MTDLCPIDRMIADLIAEVGPEHARAVLEERVTTCTVVELAALLENWRLWARPKQLPPEGEWMSWGFLGGRAMGKTWAVSRFVNEEVAAGRARLIGLAAQDEANSVALQVNGENGLIATAPRHNKPVYHPSKLELEWPNGATASVRTPEVPGKIRGPEYDIFWACELQSWPVATRQEAWDMIEFSTRVEGRESPSRIVWDCTPKRGHPLLRARLQEAEENPDLHRIVRGTMRENAGNLSRGFVSKMERKYAGTTRGREELDGEMLEDEEAATVAQSVIERYRRPMPARFRRRVVSVDPSESARGDAVGLLRLGLGEDGQGYVVANHSAKMGASTWGALAVEVYLEDRCDCMVLERNAGGDMVVETIRAQLGRRDISVVVLGKADRAPPHNPRVIHVREVYARESKSVRASAIGTAYEQGTVSHVEGGARLDALEETLTTWVQGTTKRSPGDLDALVHGLVELLGLATERVDHSKGVAGIMTAQRELMKSRPGAALTSLLAGARGRGRTI
jgi:phage terminase large subunit-like protein